MLQKFVKSSSKLGQAVNTKSAERQKISFPKEQIENAGLYKSVFNKIMTTQKQCVKYNFIAPLSVILSTIKNSNL